MTSWGCDSGTISLHQETYTKLYHLTLTGHMNKVVFIHLHQKAQTINKVYIKQNKHEWSRSSGDSDLHGKQVRYTWGVCMHWRHMKHAGNKGSHTNTHSVVGVGISILQLWKVPTVSERQEVNYKPFTTISNKVLVWSSTAQFLFVSQRGKVIALMTTRGHSSRKDKCCGFFVC